MDRISNTAGASAADNEADRGATGSANWYQNMTRAWGSALDRQATRTADLASDLASGNDAPGAALLVAASAHQLSYLSTAASTASNSIGQALEALGRKQ